MVQETKQNAENAGGGTGAQGRDAALRECPERLQALRSAWGVLAPSQVSGENQVIAETGRALNESLKQLLESEPSDDDAAAIAALRARLDELERQMRDVALEVPVPELRTTLPDRIAVDRRGVLDLLDLVLSAEVAGLDGTRARIPLLDYLITLLCTGAGDGSPLQDPVALTTRLHGLCERAETTCDQNLTSLEGEFLSAAQMQRAEVREEMTQRTLRRRKMELGPAFFVPRVLRAIIMYNAAMLQRVDEEVMSSQDWGSLPNAEAPSGAGSVFESPSLPQLAKALRRRAADAPPAHDPLDRIAWCLDLGYLTAAERQALLSEHTGRREELVGTTVLVGLLMRSAVVLDEEFPAIGLAADQLSGPWARELDRELQKEVNQRIASDGYDAACALADLKGRFLGTGDSGPRPARRLRPSKPAPARAAAAQEAPPKENRRQQARDIASEALASLDKDRQKSSPATDPGALRRRLTAFAGVALVTVVVAGLVNTIFFGPGRFARAELAQISPFLVEGRRSLDGIGSAFAGTLEDEWANLGPAGQTEAAQSLVRALRERGVTEIMIFDGQRNLRVQALGRQPITVVPAPGA